MIVLLLIAGFETTTHLISDSVLALEQYPEQKAWVLADPADAHGTRGGGNWRGSTHRCRAPGALCGA